MYSCKKIVVARKARGIPQEGDFRLEIEEDVGKDLQDKEFLCQAEWISVDPYLRQVVPGAQVVNLDIGQVVPGGQVAKVIKSRNENFPVGAYIVGYLGWRTLTVANPRSWITLLPAEIKGKLSQSLALGVLGMPGMTAYFGFLDICKPKPGHTVVVSTAAGAVGSLVGQIAKIHGCTAIGFTGSDEKVAWLKELGYDYAFNYHKIGVDEALQQAAPNGVDSYFDNVGGEFSSKVLWHMNEHGRVSVCGHITSYNDLEEKITMVPCVQAPVILKQLTMTGFIVFQWEDKYPIGIKAMAQWINEGKIKIKETITEGFENIPKSFISLFKGENIGKAVVHV